MDVVLGVAVTGRVARLAMVGSPASGGEVFDQYALDLPDDAMTDLADTIVGTYREVADSGNRVAATRLCLPDASQAETLRQSVSGAGVQNVEVVAETEAATALARSVGADAALLLADDDTVSLTVVGEDEESTSVLASLPIGAAGAAVACAAVLQQVPSEAPPGSCWWGSGWTLIRLRPSSVRRRRWRCRRIAGFAIARGAAQTAERSGFAAAGAATQMAPAAAEATLMAPAAGDATQMAPAAADATQMAPARRSGGGGPAAGVLAGGAGRLRDALESIEEFVPEPEDEQPYTDGDRAAAAEDRADGQCAGVRGDELRDAGGRGRGQHPAGGRRGGTAGAGHAVADGAGALPAAAAARAGSGGAADRGGVAGARCTCPAENPDQQRPGARECAAGPACGAAWAGAADSGS